MQQCLFPFLWLESVKREYFSLKFDSWISWIQLRPFLKRPEDFNPDPRPFSLLIKTMNFAFCIQYTNIQTQYKAQGTSWMVDGGFTCHLSLCRPIPMSNSAFSFQLLVDYWVQRSGSGLWTDWRFKFIRSLVLKFVLYTESHIEIHKCLRLPVF